MNGLRLLGFVMLAYACIETFFGSWMFRGGFTPFTDEERKAEESWEDEKVPTLSDGLHQHGMEAFLAADGQLAIRRRKE